MFFPEAQLLGKYFLCLPTFSNFEHRTLCSDKSKETEDAVDNLIMLEWDRSKDHYIKPVKWAGTMITITQENENIIFACKESVLFNDKSLSLLAQGLMS